MLIYKVFFFTMECYIYFESLKSTIKQILTKLFIKKKNHTFFVNESTDIPIIFSNSESMCLA